MRERVAATPNGRHVYRVDRNSRSWYEVQPHNDNYWMCTPTLELALAAYADPARYRDASDQLRRETEVVA
jgi:hypothetical protein